MRQLIELFYPYSELEEFINKLQQLNCEFFETLWFFEVIHICSALIEKLSLKPEKIEDKMKWFLSQRLSPGIINIFFCAAAKKGHLDIVQYLMRLPDIDPTTQNNQAIRWASRNKHEEIVKALALSHYYNPFKPDITPKEQEEKINLLNELIEKEYVIKVLEEANPKFICFYPKFSLFTSGSKDVDRLITIKGIMHDLQDAPKPN